MIGFRVLVSALCERFTSMGACFGLCFEYTSNDDEPMHIQRVQMTLQQERHISEDNSVLSLVRNKSFKSAQENLSPGSTSSAENKPEANCNTTDETTPFINHGLLQWNEQRKVWIGDRSHTSLQRRRDPSISLTSSYEGLLGPGHKFVEPVPLSDLVSLLVQAWEEEGLHE